MAKQSITAPVYPVNNVSALPDIVTNQATTVKTTLDKASVDIKAYETNLIAELNGNNGSKKIGHSSMNVTSNNVGDAIEEVITAINGVVLGDVPNGSITDAKLNADNKVGSLASLGTTDKSSAVNAVNEVKTQANGLSTNVSTLSTDLNIIRTAKLTTGLVNVMAVDTDGTFDLTKNGNILTIIPNLTTTNVTVTVSPDGQTAKLVKKANDIGNFVALDIGDLKKNTPTQLVWDSVNDFFVFAPKGGNPLKTLKNISVLSTTSNVSGTFVSRLSVTGQGWITQISPHALANNEIRLVIDGTPFIGTASAGVQFGSTTSPCASISMIRFNTSFQVLTTNNNQEVSYVLGSEFNTATPMFYTSGTTTSGQTTRLSVTGNGYVIGIAPIGTSKNIELLIDSIPVYARANTEQSKFFMYRFNSGFELKASANTVGLHYILD